MLIVNKDYQMTPEEVNALIKDYLLTHLIIELDTDTNYDYDGSTRRVTVKLLLDRTEIHTAYTTFIK